MAEYIGLYKYIDENGVVHILYPVTRTDAIDAVSDLPMGGHKVTGLGTPTADGDAVNLEYVSKFFVESTDYPGCYYRMVDGDIEWLSPPMIPGMDYRTTERWNSVPVYTKMLIVGNLGTDVTNIVEHGLSDVVFLSVIGVAVAGATSLMFTYEGDRAATYVQSDGVYFVSKGDMSAYHGYVVLKYRK